MKRKGKDSKLNVVLTALLVVFVCLLSFSIGVISGKGWSDREYKVRHNESDNHLKAALADTEPLGDEMTEKEVELLTQRALKEAKAQQPELGDAESEISHGNREVATEEAPMPEKETEEGDGTPDSDEPEPLGREASTAQSNANVKSADRKVSSLIPRPTTPKPTSLEYTVQVAAYKTMDEAELHSQRLIDKGFPAFPVQAIIEGQTWYRVSIGSFKSRRQAIKYEKALKKQAVVKNTFVQKISRLKK